LDSIRGRVQHLEENLADSLQLNQAAQQNLVSIRALIQLQTKEADLGRQRLEQLEGTVNELEQRKAQLREKIQLEQKLVRESLAAIQRSEFEAPRALNLTEGEALEAPRRKVLGNMAARGLRELEVLQIDLDDARNLETRIAEERRQIEWLFHDLEERRGILELNRSIQADLLKKRQAERLAQLENYRKLKTAETEVSRLIRDFNARRELEKTVENEKQIRKTLASSDFEKWQGKLPSPVPGGVLVSQYGRSFDAASGLQVFKKGVDIRTAALSEVHAVHAGKIAFVGDMPNLGKITIVDHGGHYYTLYGRLGQVTRGVGELISAGQPLGRTDAKATALYFEVRARNLPVNPAQWIAFGSSARQVASK
jgi:septal ring factor EnvC (AmiA/AmiB activator)